MSAEAFEPTCRPVRSRLPGLRVPPFCALEPGRQPGVMRVGQRSLPSPVRSGEAKP